ncbi:uncharacterized protein SCHCODRAFT_02516278 [Schizophyllum commune H4-8]|uniref:Expressed protein n=1 Tax=Schizophyllum commune (strain H4-8 / FGSC 9210) TaxID=578458 RepID=D8QH02_SCHCM|nr:uncharacterized protein SCHCODRAFT_02516278 [Schizophyllum commune H4-8]KAI5886965.1 hypothetical protein SCHCODRAFT_02516278 [Schizophyllum commune H4-8]
MLSIFALISPMRSFAMFGVWRDGYEQVVPTSMQEEWISQRGAVSDLLARAPQGGTLRPYRCSEGLADLLLLNLVASSAGFSLIRTEF